MANLVIVESPTKAGTIKGYLGSSYKVIASKGHIRDLPKSTLGVDLDNNFEPRYINIRGKGDVIAQLKREAKNANKIFLATDPDREGEAISWHLATALGIPTDKACRVTFNEITKSAVKEAIKKPRCIDLDLVNSQQARRILDRIVGYQLSPFLWKNVKSGLSAGRVQSVATRIVCEREAEIQAFIPQEYWTIEATLAYRDGIPVIARFVGYGEEKARIENREMADAVLATVGENPFKVLSVKHAQKSKMPAAPFTTSTLQQEASRKLGFHSQHTMKVAQELYEGINLGSQYGGLHGLITYMRTDSTRISEGAQAEALAYVAETYGEAYVPKKPNVYKSKGKAQDAHEAIRPSYVSYHPDQIRARLTPDQYKLYRLIWEHYVASQMAPAVYDTVTVELDAGGARFRAGGYTVKFNGYTTLYEVTEKEEVEHDEILKAGKLPPMKAGETLEMQEILPEQHFTEAPPRYNDASLIKVLEDSGIGRPSTFATIISTIISREYVKRVGRNLVPTQLGEVTTQLMKDNFPDIVDYEFTAQLEDRLDSIEHKAITMQDLLESFYRDFKRSLEVAMDNAEKQKIEVPVEESDVVCEKCGSKMIYKSGRFGKFLACPNYPKCRNTKAVDKQGNVVEKVTVQPKSAGFTCENCGADMVIRTGKFGEFYACSNYPQCRTTKQKIQETGVNCPKCNARIVVRHSKDRRVFYSCERYPECDYSSWDMPLQDKCPDCGSMLVYKKAKKSAVCTNPNCHFERQQDVQVIE